MQTQNQRLLDHLKIAPVTPLQAWDGLGIYRLAARIKDLRDDGHSITKETVAVENRFGEPCRVAEYRLTPFEQAERMAKQLKTIQSRPVKHHQEQLIIKTLLVGLEGA